MTNIIKNNKEETLENKIDGILGDLKYTNKIKQKHENSIKNILDIIKVYFKDKYGFHCSVETDYDCFSIKPNMDYYISNHIFNEKSKAFKFTARIIADFCDDFQCELLLFENYNCECKFKFVDSDLKNVFYEY
jgi:hypothetical protein